MARIVRNEEFEPGAVARRRDGKVVPALVFVHATGAITFVGPTAGTGPSGSMGADEEGVYWARGEWDSEAVVALRALVALDSR